MFEFRFHWVLVLPFALILACGDDESSPTTSGDVFADVDTSSDSTVDMSEDTQQTDAGTLTDTESENGDATSDMGVTDINAVDVSSEDATDAGVTDDLGEDTPNDLELDVIDQDQTDDANLDTGVEEMADAEIDTPEDLDDMEPEAIRVQVHLDEGATAMVVFVGPGDEVVEEGVDEQGWAAHAFNTATVTGVISYDYGYFELYTVVGAEAGDSLEMGYPDLWNEVDATVQVTMPPNVLTEVDDYIWRVPGLHSSSGYRASRSLEVDLGRAGGDVIDVMAYALGAEPDFALLGFVAMRNVALSVDMAAAVVFESWITEFDQISVILSDVPEGVTYLDHFVRGFTDHLEIFFQWGRLKQANPGAGSSHMRDIDVPPDVFDFLVSQTRLHMAGSSSGRWAVGPATDDVSVDLSTDMLIGPTDASMRFDTPGALEVSWTDTGASIDAITVELSWFESDIDGLWTVVLPPETESPLLLPTLSTYLGDQAPAEIASFNEPAVVYNESNRVDSYTEYRNVFGGSWGINRMTLVEGLVYRRAGPNIDY